MLSSLFWNLDLVENFLVMSIYKTVIMVTTGNQNEGESNATSQSNIGMLNLFDDNSSIGDASIQFVDLFV